MERDTGFCPGKMVQNACTSGENTVQWIGKQNREEHTGIFSLRGFFSFWLGPSPHPAAAAEERQNMVRVAGEEGLS